jgi:resuscitation-promoting factor RpfA
MKCPTCGYIGFESTDRCRNCGYEFALSTPSPPAQDLSLSSGEADGPLQDLAIRDGGTPVRTTPAARGPRTAPAPDLDRVMQNLDRVIGAPEPAAADLPLFDRDAEPDLPPLVNAGAEPRRPLSVRRATPDPARLKPKPVRHQAAPAAPSLDLPLPSVGERHEPRRESAVFQAQSEAADVEAAPPLLRGLAALVDVAILGAIDALVISFTLRLCGLETSELGMLPPIPIIAFFLIVNGGYLAAFTAAGGQTIGKMAFGLKVVGQSDAPLSVGTSIVRTFGCLLSIASLGLGFAPALVGAGGRTLEDRLAHTRVVRMLA